MGAKPKQSSPARRARHAAEYALLVLVARLVRWMPGWAVPFWSAAAGGVAYLLFADSRRVAYANLAVALGDSLPPAARRRVVRGTFRRLAEVVIGLFRVPDLTPEKLRRRLDPGGVLDVLRGLEARGKGVVVATAHYGDWELLCAAAGLLGCPMLIVTEPIRNPRVEAFVSRLRAATGNRTVPPRFALLKLFRELRQGGRVAMTVDVNGRRGRGGVWLDFFGLPVFNGTALAELALRTGAAVLFVVAKPLPGGRARLVCAPPIQFTPTADPAADVRALSQQVLDCCRDLIRADPEPWLWTYKRWKRKPTPDAAGYPFYARYARTE